MNDENNKKRIIVNNESAGSSEVPHDILVIASKLKSYIKARHGLNTSGDVIERLSDIIRSRCDEAAVWARSDGRKTLMDRDFK
ncbi:MAG: hypothetical protein HYV97_06860 [Bdellovibrio sp.]|nr:hypothetical protein [Bdellovibrio sp.]